MILNGIAGLDFELADSFCVIKKGQKFDISGTGDINTFTRCGIWYLKAEKARISITLPQNSELSLIRIRLVGSQLHSCDFRAIDTELRMSDSVCACDGVCSRSLYAELGEGSAELNVPWFKSSSFNCGSGKMSIKFGLHKQDCSLRTQRGIGCITVDGVQLPRSWSSDVNGRAEVFIKCGLGSVNAVFSG